MSVPRCEACPVYSANERVVLHMDAKRAKVPPGLWAMRAKAFCERLKREGECTR